MELWFRILLVINSILLMTMVMYMAVQIWMLVTTMPMLQPMMAVVIILTNVLIVMAVVHVKWTVLVIAVDLRKWMNVVNVMVMVQICAGMAVMSVMHQTVRMFQVAV